MDKVLEDTDIEYSRGRPRKREGPGHTATEEHARDQDGTHRARKQRLGSPPGTRPS